MSRRAAFLPSMVVISLVAAMSPAPVRAETFDKLAYMTFSGRVQIPGARLDSGTYRFRLANPDTGRNVMQVLSYDGSTVYAMFQTLPDNRTTVADNPTVTFRETPAGVPPAVKSLFYGGEHRGYEFIYPKGESIVSTALTPQPKIELTPNPAPAAAASSAPNSASAVAESPAPNSPSAVAESAASNPAEPAQAPEPPKATTSASTPEPPTPANELPGTASPLPLVVLGGFSSLIVGLGLGLIRRLTS